MYRLYVLLSCLYLGIAIGLCVWAGLSISGPKPCNLSYPAYITEYVQFNSPNVVKLGLTVLPGWSPTQINNPIRYNMLINNTLATQLQLYNAYQNNTFIKVYKNCNSINPQNYYLWEHYYISGIVQALFVHSILHLIAVVGILVYNSCNLYIHNKAAMVYDYVNPPVPSSFIVPWTEDDLLDDDIDDII